MNIRAVTMSTEERKIAIYDPRMERTFFITSITYQRQVLFKRDAVAALLIEVLQHYRAQRKYLLHEFVIMPDHVHALLTPSTDVSLERAVQFLKGGFSFRLHVSGPVWQASFTNHHVRDAADFRRHCEYIWMNPVRAGLVSEAKEYRYSSAGGRFVLDPAPGLKPLVLGCGTPA
jgi:putative transposase